MTLLALAAFLLGPAACFATLCVCLRLPALLGAAEAEAVCALLAGVAELLFQFQPCTMLIPHSHPRGDETVHCITGMLQQLCE